MTVSFRHYCRLMSGILVLWCTGCVSTGVGPSDDLVMQVIRDSGRFEPVADKATIYVVRDAGAGSAVMFSIGVDGKGRGVMPPNTFVMLRQSPGTHTITAIGPENRSNLTLTTEAGRNYYFLLKHKMGVRQARVVLVALSEQEGQEYIMRAGWLQMP